MIGQRGEQVFSSAAPGTNRGQAVAKRVRHLFQVVGLPPKPPRQFRHGHQVQNRIAGLTNSTGTSLAVNPDIAALLNTLSKEQLSEALIAIAQQLAH